MCGIVGYSGHRQALPILLACLKRVEYRGYDSCGVALPTEQEVIAYKDLGYVETLQSKVNHLSGTTGIGHTRWATVGKPSRENAHPHLDCTNRIALVHNGDVDNFYPLKQQLLQTGHRFRSETDSEVIAHLIEDNYHGDLREAVVKATALLEGSYALAVVASGFPGFVVTRKESPLVLGVGQGESFAASDVPALLEYTREVIYLEDGQLAVLTPSAIEVWRDGTKAEPKVHRVSWSLQELDRAGYPHFMLKEIHEQPRVV
ncbi:MAG: glutamine--fructose-6-phosphate transaminase (isomerizing), partial [Chloroflexi bacterium]|nr:glutamine--fructose-6-phosphate transaminase (isomerizing) [Chloroflexota bacterium]